MTLLYMCLQFMKIGLFAIGGGLATIPFLQELGKITGWFTHHDILNMLAISESTPGPIGINMSTYVGYHVSGWYGAILATLSLALPSIIVILIVAHILDKFRHNRFVEGGFYFLRPMSTAMVAASTVSIAAAVFFGAEDITMDVFTVPNEVFTEFNFSPLIVFVVMFCFMRFAKKGKVMQFINNNVIIYILIGGLLGLIFEF